MLLIPDAEFKSVTDISIKFLKSHGIRGLALDLDNTLSKYSESIPSCEVCAWLSGLRSHGISTVVVSNSHKPERVGKACAALGVEYHIKSNKPSRKGFRWAVMTMGLKPHEVAAVGDQIFTDVLGAKRAGCKAIIVYPRGMDENFLFKLRRIVELPFIRRARYTKDGQNHK